jgi:hypothetical protein
MKKISFCLPVPSENLVQILLESGSGSALDPDLHSSKMLDPEGSETLMMTMIRDCLAYMLT